MALIIIVTQLRAPAEGRGPSLLEASLSPGLSPGAPPVTRLLPSRAPPTPALPSLGGLGLSRPHDASHLGLCLEASGHRGQRELPWEWGGQERFYCPRPGS